MVEAAAAVDTLAAALQVVAQLAAVRPLAVERLAEAQPALLMAHTLQLTLLLISSFLL
jgi:hypothetical protein